MSKGLFQLTDSDKLTGSPSSSHETKGISGMSKVLFEETGRLDRITLNRPDVMNAVAAEPWCSRPQSKNRTPSLLR